MEYPTVDGSTVVCFESHLVAGLALSPSKFLVAIMNFLRCELASEPERHCGTQLLHDDV
jgi:hypothetical protein